MLEYDEWYQSGECLIKGRVYRIPPRYPVPALADTATVMCLTLGAHCIWEHDIAWDDIWQENIPDYVPFICPL